MPPFYDQRWGCLARLSSTASQQRIGIKSRTNEENGTREEAAGNCRACLKWLCWSHVHVGYFRAGLCWLSWALLAELGFAGTFWTWALSSPFCCHQHMQETLLCSDEMLPADGQCSYGCRRVSRCHRKGNFRKLRAPESAVEFRNIPLAAPGGTAHGRGLCRELAWGKGGVITHKR